MRECLCVCAQSSKLIDYYIFIGSVTFRKKIIFQMRERERNVIRLLRFNFFTINTK